MLGLCSNDDRRHEPPPLPLSCWTASTDPALAYPPPRGARLPGRAWLLDPDGHPSDLYRSEVAAAELAALLDRLRPDLVLVAGLWLASYLEVIRAAGCRVVLDCHNVEADVQRQLAAATRGDDLEARTRRDVLPARTAARERAAVRAVDQTWACSDEDAALLRRLYGPAAPTVVVPNGIEQTRYADVAAARRPPAGRTTVLFPGTFGYGPNALAARLLVEEILPLLPGGEATRLLLVGPGPGPELLAAAGRDPRIAVTGAVADVRPFLVEATVLAVPLRQGGGTHLKVLEGLAAGVPVVSTAVGAQGLAVEDGTHLLLAEGPAGLAAAIARVAAEPALAARLAAAGRELVAERYDWPVVHARVDDALAGLGLA
ncbi:MAG: glycosyltransferase family 4 protein [Thermoleophilia bacterium]